MNAPLCRRLLPALLLATCTARGEDGVLSQEIKQEHYEWAAHAKEQTLETPLAHDLTEPLSHVSDPCHPPRKKKTDDDKLHYARVSTQVTYLMPQAITQMADLEKLNPGLGQALPGLAKLLPEAKVSHKFARLYRNKALQIAGGEALDFKDYFDCATVLDLRDADTGRTAILFQSDMDSDTDGTDPRRFPGIEDYPAALTDPAFQPTLAYTWNEKGTPANPMIGYHSKINDSASQWQQNLTDLKAKSTSLGERFFLDRLLATSRQQGGAARSWLKRYAAPEGDDNLSGVRSLVGEKDPFIVVPEAWTKDDASLPFSVGDYVLVIYGAKVLPAIIGDTGPCEKCGEVSLKLGQAVNPRATANSAAVSEPCATYIVFPGTGHHHHRGELKPDELEAELARLVGQIGGLGKDAHLHSWKE